MKDHRKERTEARKKAEKLVSQMTLPVYNRNGNQVTASLAVKYLDNQTMTTQVSQFDLVLEKNGENWKIVK